MAEPVAPVAPPGPGPFATLRRFTFTDAATTAPASSSVTTASSTATATTHRRRAHRRQRRCRPAAPSTPVLDRHRVVRLPFSNGMTTVRANSTAPFDSRYCQVFADERFSRAIVTLNGRRVAEVVHDIRWYSTKDFSFDYANWGPDPAVHTALETAFFPVGATMEYRGQTRKATPITRSRPPPPARCASRRRTARCRSTPGRSPRRWPSSSASTPVTCLAAR